MFAGIVEALQPVTRIESRPPGVRLVVDAGTMAESAMIGHSIAVNGCCLTVVEMDGSQLGFDAGQETLSRTNLGQLVEGSRVNLERSLVVGDRLGGHFVTGHIDCVGTLHTRQDDRDWSTFWFRVPREWTRQMAPKGSVAVDGVSLTLVDVETDRFSVALIPHTLAVTTLGRLKENDRVNVETDVLAKYVAKQLEGALHA
jgi:riboflavin synthase